MISIDRQPGTYVALRNPIAWELTCDPNWASYDSYYVELVLQIEQVYGSGSFGQSIRLREYPNSMSKVVFRIEERIKAFMGEDIPGVNMIGATKLTGSVRRFEVFLQEYTDGVLTHNIAQNLPNGLHRFAYDAGFARKQGQGMAAWVAAGKFLTHLPARSDLSDVQPQLLDYVAQGAATLQGRVQIFFENDTDITVTLDTIAAAQGDRIRWGVGWRKAGIHQQGTPVARYQFYVHDGTNEVSERKTFIPQPDSSSNERYYFFQNSLGGYDVLRTAGRLSASMSVSSVQLRRLRDPWATSLDPDTIDRATTHRETCTQAVGYLNRAELDWLRDLRRSERAYRLGDRYPNFKGTGELCPIRIERGETSLYEDDQLNEYSFQYTEAYDQVGI